VAGSSTPKPNSAEPTEHPRPLPAAAAARSPEASWTPLPGRRRLPIIRRGRGECSPVAAAAPPLGRAAAIARHLETTGVVWLLVAVGLVAVFAVSFVASRHGAAVAVTAADDRVVRWLSGLRGGWLTNALQVAAFPASWLASKILAWSIVVPLLVFKRFRHRRSGRSGRASRSRPCWSGAAWAGRSSRC
jgi:hypothetical protein